MGWNYRRRVKLIPGVSLNFSKSGISTSIGVKGSSITMGKNGTYLNQSVPFLGIYSRKKISGSNPKSNDSSYLEKEYYDDPNNHYDENISVVDHLGNKIESLDVEFIGSQDLSGIKDAVFAAREERKRLEGDIKMISNKLKWNKVKSALSYMFIYGFVDKKFSGDLSQDIKSQKNMIQNLKDDLESCYVNVELKFDDYISSKYEELRKSFAKLLKCEKIWDITSVQFNDTFVTRSAAGTTVKRTEVKFDFKSFREIKCDYKAFHFYNQNGAQLLFYPTFLLVLKNKNEFALISYEDLGFYFAPERFIEQSPQKDTKIIDYTWAKVNKNGTPDKRFKGNYKIPIVLYGNLKLSTKQGLNEEYSFSNYEFSEDFCNKFIEYKSLVKTIF